MSQIERIVIEAVYNEYGYENPGLRVKEISNKPFEEAAAILFARVDKIQNQLCALEKKDWCAEFSKRCQQEHATQSAVWDAEWLTLCNGKQFFLDIHSQFDLNISPRQFKRLIIERMEREQSEGWVLLEKLLSDSIHV